MVIGGNEQSPLELVDISNRNPASRCYSGIEDYPLKTKGQTIVLLQGKTPAVCGGQYAGIGDTCFLLTEENKSWIQGASLSKTRFQGLAFPISDTEWMVATGNDNTADILSLDGPSDQVQTCQFQ